MKQVRAQYKKDRDFRTLARDILSGHILVKRIEIADSELTFIMRNGGAGKVTLQGTMSTGTSDDDGYVHNWFDWPGRPARTDGTKQASPSNWDAPGSGLDDEIPF